MARPATAAALEMRSRCKNDANRALVAGQGSTMLPASQKVTKLAFFLCGPCLQQRIPRGNVVAPLAEASGRVTCCCEGRSPSRTVVRRLNERLPAARVLEWSASSPPRMPSRWRGRRRRPSAHPGRQTAKGAVRDAASAEPVAADCGGRESCDSRVASACTAASCSRAKASVAPGGRIRSK